MLDLKSLQEILNDPMSNEVRLCISSTFDGMFKATLYMDRDRVFSLMNSKIELLINEINKQMRQLLEDENVEE